MSKKRPTWTRSRAGRNRVHWVAYDDQPGGEETQIVDQGYALSLVAADTAARAALAEAGIYGARRMSSGFGRAVSRTTQPEAQPAPRPPRPIRPPPREYLYTRHHDSQGDSAWAAAHLILKKTARKIYVTRRSCGPDQLGTDDETWGENEPKIALDRSKLDQDGAVFAVGYRQSEFYRTRDMALGESTPAVPSPLRVLGLSAPCTIEEIKAAYRLRAFEVHPDRGGNPDIFRAVEAAYRRLLREAQSPEA